MVMSIETLNETVVNCLGELIRRALSNKAHEQFMPSSDADKSDMRIQDYGQRVIDLRRIREEFEDIASGVVL